MQVPEEMRQLAGVESPELRVLRPRNGAVKEVREHRTLVVLKLMCVAGSVTPASLPYRVFKPGAHF
jgi:hypothetical protein